MGLRTSVNWDTSEWGLSGMLEHQIEHHLFPSLPYDVQRYRLRPLVKDTAAKFRIPYIEHSNGAQGILRHCAYMRALGMNEERERSESSPDQTQCRPILAIDDARGGLDACTSQPKGDIPSK